MIWADEEEGEGLHANFKLSKNGESLTLVRQQGDQLTVLDRVDFQQQTKDVSFGRFPNWNGGWQALAPTPGQANRASE